MCAVAHEYDITRMLVTVESWLMTAVHQGAILQVQQTPNQHYNEYYARSCGGSYAVERIATSAHEWVYFLKLARDYKLKAFAAATQQRINVLSVEDARLVLNTETEEALM